MKPMHGPISVQWRRALQCVPVMSAFGLVLALTLHMSVALPTAAVAQGQARQKPPKAVPQEPVAERATKPEVTIAMEVNISLSAARFERLREPLTRLDRLLYRALKDEDIDAGVRSADASGGKYVPPGDDDLSFANSGDADAEISDRINAGFPKLAGPLVLMTVAERGPYVIAAAYVFSPNDKGGGTLRRVGRNVGTDADESTVEKVWPKCFAESIKRFVKNEPLEEDSRECQKPEPQGAAPQGTPSKPAPQGAAPQGTPNKSAALAPKTGGMLDGVPETPGVQKIPAVPQPPVQGQGRPATPSQTPRNAGPGKPAPATTPSPETERHASIDPNRQLAKRLDPSETRLLREVFAYGFIWRARDDIRERMIGDAISEMVSKPDSAGECLRKQKAHIRSSASHTIEGWIINELREGLGPTLDVTPRGFNHFLFHPLKNDTIWSARSCLPPQRPFPPLELYGHVKTTKKEIALVNVRYDEARALVDTWRQKEGGWRFPSAIEGFAVASALPYDGDLAAALGRFWILLDSQPGILNVEWGPGASGLRVVDYVLLRDLPGPQQSVPPSASLVAVRELR